MSAYSIATRGLAGRKIPQGVLAPMNALLFGSGEQGAWYDPSDLSTLFQDSAGTTPVTAVEQPVGRMLDKSGRGNHATQATTTKRPIYSRRVNLLPSNNGSAWAKNTGVSFSVSGVGEVHPGSNVFKLSYNGSGNVNTYRAYVGGTISASGAQYSTFVYLRADAPVTVRINGNNVAGPNTTVNVTTSWQKFSISGTGNGASIVQFLIYSALDNNDPFEVYLSSSDTRLSIDAHLPYQWVNTATDYDTAGFPYYLRFDGVDDAIVTGNIDFTGTDNVTVWAGVEKLSDAAVALIASSGIGSGAFELFGPRSAGGGQKYAFSTRNGSVIEAISGTERSAPDAAVLTGISNTSGGVATLRRNGVDLAVSTASPSGVNHGNYPLSIGSRAGTAYFLNGRLYSLIVRGAQSSLSQIEATEAYIKQKMRLP